MCFAMARCYFTKNEYDQRENDAMEEIKKKKEIKQEN